MEGLHVHAMEDVKLMAAVACHAISVREWADPNSLSSGLPIPDRDSVRRDSSDGLHKSSMAMSCLPIPDRDS